MPTLEELEGLSKAPAPELPQAVAPQQAAPQPQPQAPQNPLPTLDELLRLTNPRLDHSMDGPAPLAKSADFVRDNFSPGLHYDDENIPFEQRSAASRFREKGFAGLTPEEAMMKQQWGSRAWGRAFQSFADTVLDT